MSAAPPASHVIGEGDDDEAYDAQQRREALWRPPHAGGSAELKAHRHIHIDSPNGSIKKTLAIGASAPDAHPPVYDRPRAEDEAHNAASCVLVTKSSPINATVHIVKEKKSGPPSPQVAATTTAESAVKPILISAKTGAVATIVLTIPAYTGARPLDIRAKSYNGSITIYLPASFAGMLSWTSETGSLKVSPAMQQRFKLLDPQPRKRKGTAKISPSTASGLRGDVCTITNHHGSITIKEVDEDAAGASGSKSCVIQ